MTHTKKYMQLLVACALFASSMLESRSCNEDECCPIRSTATVCAPVVVDYVIIGLGTAGAGLARYLSGPDNGPFTDSVLVLEAGGQYNTDPAILASSLLAAAPLAFNPQYSNTFSTLVSGVNVGFAGFLYSDGRLWGGSSAHNGLDAVRSSFDIYDNWAAISGNSRWLYANLLPVMKGMEHFTVAAGSPAPDLSQRGVAGALFISQEPYTPTISADPLSIQFAITAGAPLTSDYNVQAASVATSSLQDFVTPPAGAGFPTSIRSFSATAFLPQSVLDWNTGLGLGGRRLQVVSHATASHILFDQSGSTPTAVGVEYILDGNRENVRQVFARKKIILCAGAIQNVGILQRSGVGPSALLTGLSIPVIVDNANVGANMQNHVGTSALMQVPFPGPFGIAQAFIDCSTAAGIGANFSAGVRRNQLLYVIGSGLFGSPSATQALGIDFATTTSLYTSFATFNIKPQSRGTAMIVDADPLTDVKVDFNFYSDGTIATPGSDAQNIVAALRIIQQTALAIPGATMIFPTPAQYAAGDAALFAAAVNLPFVTYHAAGSCSMGTSIANGVVDGDLHVFGVNNLMCADCSIEPEITTGNTAYAAYVIGLEAAIILGATVPTA